MVRNLRGSHILLLFALAVGCAKKVPPPEFAYDRTANFDALRSYSWFVDPTWVPPEGNSIVDSQFIDRTIRAAVNDGLARKGFDEVNGDASFYVSYREGPAGGISQDKWDLATQKPSASPAQGIDFHDFTNIGAHRDLDLSPEDGGDVGTRYRKLLTVSVTIRDSSRRPVWCGVRTTGIGTNPKDVARDLRDAVAFLLARFPPRSAVETR